MTVFQLFNTVLAWFAHCQPRSTDDTVSPGWLADREYRAGKTGFPFWVLCVGLMASTGCTVPMAPTPVEPLISTLGTITCEAGTTPTPAPVPPFARSEYGRWIQRERQLMNNSNTRRCYVSSEGSVPVGVGVGGGKVDYFEREETP